MRSLLLTALTIAVIVCAAFWWISEPRPALPREQWAAYEKGGDAARGRLVFFAGGCASCHATPGQPDRLLLGGGLALKSAFGTFYVPNISPDPKDGIGAWKVVDLANAMLSGVSPADSHYYPAFPFTSFQRVKIEDIRDLMAFLRTLAPVAGKIRGNDLMFPFGIRRTLGIWKLLFMDGAKLDPDPSRSADWNRGRYLVEGLGHCAECHSPRNFLGAIIADKRFTGGDGFGGAKCAPDITPTKNGIGAWSRTDIVQALTAYRRPDHPPTDGIMTSVVRDLDELPAADRQAMADYLKSMPMPGGKSGASGR